MKIIKIIENEKFYLPIIYIIISTILYTILKCIINKIKNNKHISKNKKNETVISLIKNILKYVIYICAVLGILNVYGIDTTSIIASIGIVSLLIGLALQDIIKDFLAGVLILFDNKYAIGDIISIGNFKGEVISFGLMSTKIKNDVGEVKIISNSSFKEVINYSCAYNNLIINLKFSSNIDVDKIDKILKELTNDVLKIENVKKYNVLGIDNFSETEISYIISIECNPNTEYMIKKEYYKLIKETFNKNNIKML